MSICLHVDIYTTSMLVPREARSPGPGITGNCEPPNVNAQNQAWTITPAPIQPFYQVPIEARGGCAMPNVDVGNWTGFFARV